MIIVGQVTIADNHILYIRGIDDIHVQATINGIVTSFKLKKIIHSPTVAQPYLYMTTYRKTCRYSLCS